MRIRRPRAAPLPRSAFAGFRFPPDVIVLAVRWYLRFGLSYRDVEELLAERGITVDHVTVYRGCSASRGRCAPVPPRSKSRQIAPVYPRVLDELIPSALHIVEQYANNPIEADHGRLKARLRPMRGMKLTAQRGL